jgi:hypothetical protein
MLQGWAHYRIGVREGPAPKRARTPAREARNRTAATTAPTGRRGERKKGRAEYEKSVLYREINGLVTGPAPLRHPTAICRLGFGEVGTSLFFDT